MLILGTILILVSLGFTAWWVLNDRKHKAWAFGMGLLAGFFGAFFIMNDRVLELTIPSIGTLRTAAKQAETDAGAISEVRQQIEGQAEAIQELREATEQGAGQVADALDYIRSLREEMDRTSDRVEDLDEKLRDIPISAAPQLEYLSSTFRSTESGLTGRVLFRPTSSASLSSVEFRVSIVGASDARITAIKPSVPVSLMVSTSVSPDGRQARLKYTVVGNHQPGFSLELSAPASLRIEGEPGISSFQVQAHIDDGDA